MKKVGLLINPIAGMGGRVGLKGTDGADILQIAKQRGAKPESSTKAIQALKMLLPLRDDVLFFVSKGSMGEMAVRTVGLRYEVIDEAGAETTSADSTRLLKKFRALDIDLVLFAGGDGTARDVAKVIGLTVPVVGIPTGVKIHSPVFARTPKVAGQLVFDYLTDIGLDLIEKEVIDIEETAFRADEIITAVYGYLMVPNHPDQLQNLKSPSPQDETSAQEAAALQVIDQMETGIYYIIGSGSTTSRLMAELGLAGTQLGIDIIKDGQLIAKDVAEKEILSIIQDQPTKLIVTPMGGQGYLFGRGNQQLSDNVLALIAKDDIIILSTPGKLNTLFGRPLWIYTGDEIIDQKLSGYYKIVIGYGKYAIYKASPA